MIRGYRLAGHLVREYMLPLVSGLPTALNLPLTSRCNCRCTMCGVWDAPPMGADMAVAAVAEFLSDPFLRRVNAIGLSGGEPFLREDLTQVVAACCAHRGLRSLTISTNGQLPDVIEQEAPRHVALCRSKGIRLRYSLSIDAIGKVHDAVRGVAGAWDRVLRSLNWLQEYGQAELRIGCTLSPVNVEEAFNVMDFARRRGVIPTFRVASRIARLHNFDRVGEDWYKDPAYRGQLYEWFQNLACTRWMPVERRIFYRDLADVLAGRGPRHTRCAARLGRMPFIDESGGAYWCAVAGQRLGDVRQSLRQVYQSPEGMRCLKEMRQEACVECTHDYHTVPPVGYAVATLLRQTRTPSAGELAKGMANILTHRHIRGRQRAVGAEARLLVTGWWGTETVGDRAILGALLRDIWRERPQWRFDVLSSDAPYSQETLRQLGVEQQVNIISLDDALSSRFLRGYDALVFGGGPLMDIVGLQVQAAIAAKAAAQGVPTVLYGCGFGPAHKRRTRWAIRELMRRSRFIGWRDSASAKQAALLLPTQTAGAYSDPAFSYVAAWAGQQRPAEPGRPRLAVAIRKWPRHYFPGLSTREAARHATEMTESLAAALDAQVERGWEVVLIPMNTFWRGDDDRLYLAEVKARCRHAEAVRLLPGAAQLDQVLREVAASRVVLGMRFHSLVFAVALGKPIVAIDYSLGGGKVAALMSELGLDRFRIPILDVVPGLISDKLQAVEREDAAFWSQCAQGRVTVARRLAGDMVAVLERSPTL